MQMSGSVWARQNTTPAEVEVALRDLLKERHARSEAYVPARVLNLVVVTDREWRGEIQNRLDQVGRYHASRIGSQMAHWASTSSSRVNSVASPRMASMISRS